MKRCLRQGGFTIVEIGVTMAIIGILAAIAIPSMVNLMPRIKLGNATHTLANDVAMLRMTAIAKSTNAELAVNDAADSYSLRKTVGGAPFSTVSVTDFGSLEGPAYLDGSPAAPSTVQLLANGTTSVPLQEQAVAITLQTADGTARRRVLIWSTGRIYSQKWDGDDAGVVGTWVEE